MKCKSGLLNSRFPSMCLYKTQYLVAICFVRFQTFAILLAIAALTPPLYCTSALARIMQ